MSELTGSYKRLKSLTHQVITKETDCRIEESERGEIVIYTGLVSKGTRYRVAKPEEQMDYIPPEELQEYLEQT